ncbi:DNA segregation ATPase FtsK/SpoIIIE, S-DNA-T family [Balamuthia mandrillaris]
MHYPTSAASSSSSSSSSACSAFPLAELRAMLLGDDAPLAPKPSSPLGPPPPPQAASGAYSPGSSSPSSSPSCPSPQACLSSPTFSPTSSPAATPVTTPTSTTSATTSSPTPSLSDAQRRELANLRSAYQVGAGLKYLRPHWKHLTPQEQRKLFGSNGGGGEGGGGPKSPPDPPDPPGCPANNDQSNPNHQQAQRRSASYASSFTSEQQNNLIPWFLQDLEPYPQQQQQPQTSQQQTRTQIPFSPEQSQPQPRTRQQSSWRSPTQHSADTSSSFGSWPACSKLPSSHAHDLLNLNHSPSSSTSSLFSSRPTLPTQQEHRRHSPQQYNAEEQQQAVVEREEEVSSEREDDCLDSSFSFAADATSAATTPPSLVPQNFSPFPLSPSSLAFLSHEHEADEEKEEKETEEKKREHSFEMITPYVAPSPKTTHRKRSRDVQRSPFPLPPNENKQNNDNHNNNNVTHRRLRIWNDNAHLQLLTTNLAQAETYRSTNWLLNPTHPASVSAAAIQYVLADRSGLEEVSSLSLNVHLTLCLGALTLGNTKRSLEHFEQTRLQAGYLFDESDIGVAYSLGTMAFLFLWLMDDVERAMYYNTMAMTICKRMQTTRSGQYFRCLYLKFLLSSNLKEMHQTKQELTELLASGELSPTSELFHLASPFDFADPSSASSLHFTIRLQKVADASLLRIVNVFGGIREHQLTTAARKQQQHSSFGAKEHSDEFMDQETVERFLIYVEDTEDLERLSEEDGLPGVLQVTFHLMALSLRAKCYWMMGLQETALTIALRFVESAEDPLFRHMLCGGPILYVWVLEILFLMQSVPSLDRFLWQVREKTVFWDWTWKYFTLAVLSSYPALRSVLWTSPFATAAQAWEHEYNKQHRNSSHKLNHGGVEELKEDLVRCLREWNGRCCGSAAVFPVLSGSSLQHS